MTRHPGCCWCVTRTAECFGARGEERPTFACVTCCTHGGEDGWCHPIHELPPQLISHLLKLDPVSDVEDFHRKFSLEYEGRPRVLPVDLADFRRKFLREEVQEYIDASHRGQASAVFSSIEDRDGEITEHLGDMLDALVDEVYVCLGTAQLHGFNFRDAWRRVHAANMTKVRVERNQGTERGGTWDVVKPPGFIAPDHADLVRNHKHRGKP